ncbi:MAG: CehA/McbA family metallohydrolase, partial [Candidatus Methylomirabilis sp.]|nr:CehA/McbA family metallohydrolase [Deltaproteobacteria bacterium]
MKYKSAVIPLLALALCWSGCGLFGGKSSQGQASILHPSSKVGDDRWYPRFTYVAGEGGVAPGGGIRFETPKKMARLPEIEDDPKGFLKSDKVSVYTTSAAAEVAAEVQDLETSYRWIVRVTGEAPVEAGAEINVNFNDNVVPANAGVYDIPIEVDRKGEGAYEKPETPPAIKIFARIELVMPSLVTAKEPFTVTANVDPGPEAPPFTGTLKFKASDPGAALPKPAAFAEGDKGRKTLDKAFVYALAGNQELRVTDLTGGAMAEKVRFPVRAEPSPYRLYWGDTHGHTSLSDGAGTPEDYFHIARYVEDLDFVVLSDHDYIVDDAVWKRIQGYTDRYYEPGAFATLLGFEYSHKLGDRTVVLRDTTMPMYRRNEPDADHPLKMFEAYRGKGAIAIPHHPPAAFRPVNWKFHDPEVQRLVEIYSLHGRSEYYGNLNPITSRTPAGEKYTTRYGVINLRERSVQDALARGYRVGIIASGDKHDGHPGNLGVVGVYAAELTREAVYDALYHRRVYASTNARAYVDFQVDGRMMGEEFTGDAPPTIEATVVGEAPIETLELVKNGRVIFIHDGDDFEESFTYVDQEPRGATSYYYLRVTQQDGEMLWTSPVWMDSPRADAAVRFAETAVSGVGPATRLHAEVENKGLSPLASVELTASLEDGTVLARQT